MMLLKSITSERDALLQDRTAFAMAKFIELCWGAGKQKTQDTVVKRLWGYGRLSPQTLMWLLSQATLLGQTLHASYRS